MDNPIQLNLDSHAGGGEMVIGVLSSSVLAGFAGLAVSASLAGNLPIMLASYVVWGMTGALCFVYASMPALNRRL